MEEKKEVLRKAASESMLAGSTLEDRLEELNSTKPKPFGTIHAVSVDFFIFVHFPLLNLLQTENLNCNYSIEISLFKSLKILNLRIYDTFNNTTPKVVNSYLQLHECFNFYHC
jgi:hypothetical protein